METVAKQSGISTAPLGVRDIQLLNDHQIAMFEKIERAELPFVQERILKEKSISPEDLDEAIFEFKRYFAIQSITDISLGMISSIIDEVWHTYILFTRAYTQFCQEVAGRYIHHLPRTSHTPIPENVGKNLIDSYERYFGNMPKIWFRETSRDEILESNCSTSTASTGSSGTCSGSSDGDYD